MFSLILAENPPGGPGALGSPLLLVAIAAIFYFIVIRSTSKQERARKDRVAKLEKERR